MGDAEIIPIGTRGRPGRGTGKQPSSAARGLAPRKTRRQADRPRRLAQAGKPEAEAQAGVQAEAGRGGGAESAAEAARPAATTSDRTPTGGIPAGDWLAAIQLGAREVFGEQWEPQLAQFLAFLRRRVTGDYAVDEYGFDQEITQRFFMATLRPIAEKWFRIEVRGVENIPTDGGALVVSNHSGTIPVDGLMTMVSIHDADRPVPAPAGRRPGLQDAVRQHHGPQGRRHPGLQRGRRADAQRRRAGRRLAGGLQGHRQAVLRALQAAALRPRRVRRGGAAHRRPDRAAVGGRRRGDLPAGRQRAVAGAAARAALHPDHAVLPAGSARSAWCRCRRSGCWSSASRSAPTSSTRVRPTTRCWSST